MSVLKGMLLTNNGRAGLMGLTLVFGAFVALPAQAEDTADSRTTRHTYNDFGLVTSVDGPRTDVLDLTAYAYDERGNRLSVTNALGHVTQYADYERNGLPGTVTDPNGLVTHLSYDWQGKITEQRVEAPEGDLITRYVYDPVGQLIQIHPPNGASLYYEYDAAQRLTTLRTEDGARLDYELDDLGNLVSVETHDELGTLVRRHQQAYDGLSRLQARIGGTDGQTTEYDYDADGNRTDITDARQQSSSQQFDALNRPVEVTDRAQGITEFEYDDRDRITAVTDPTGLTTRYDYNGHGDVVAVHSPDTGTTTYAYDPAGNRLRATDANGEVIETDYDALNRRTAIRYPATPERNVTFEYDDTSLNENGTANAGLGRPTAIRFAGGERRFRYDVLGRLVAETQVVGTQAYTARYVYNAKGQLSVRQLPSGAWLGYDYTDQGRLAGLYLQPSAEATADQRRPIVTELDYLPFGPITHLTYGNGLEQTNDYDLDYRLTEQRSPVRDSGYYYDPNSNLDQLIDYLAGASGDGDASGLFQYDALDRLITAEQADATRDYQYDPVGNRLHKAIMTDTNTETTDYGYGAQSHWLLNEADWLYEYDAAGNLLSNGRFDFAYDEPGQLSTVSDAHTGTRLADYAYNPGRQRIAKAVRRGARPRGPGQRPAAAGKAPPRPVPPAAAWQRTHYVYGPDGALWGEYDAQGRPLALIEPRARGTRRAGVTLYYYHNDQLGTPKVMTDRNQKVVWRAGHTPFGQATITTDTVTNNLRFPGQYFDAETGLHYNWHRYYDPSTGRYLTSDPIGLHGGLNTYGYALQNPVRFVDPKGRCPTGGLICGAAVVAGSYLLSQMPGAVVSGVASTTTELATGGSVTDAALSGTVAFGVTVITPVPAFIPPGVGSSVVQSSYGNMVSQFLIDGSVNGRQVILAGASGVLPGAINNFIPSMAASTSQLVMAEYIGQSSFVLIDNAIEELQQPLNDGLQCRPSAVRLF